MKILNKRLLIVLVGILVICNNGFAQPQMEWIYNYGGSDDDVGFAIIETSDGGYVVVGGSDSNDIDVYENNGSSDWWVVKVDAQGDIQWQTNLGDSGYDIASDIKQTADNGFVITGNLSLGFFSMIKLDAEGVIEWQKFHAGWGNPIAQAISLTADGGYIVAGNSNNLGSETSSDGLFMKLDEEGNLEWTKQYGGSLSDEIFSIVQTNDLGYIATGCSNSIDGDLEINRGDNDTWVLKMDAAGDLEWSKTYGGSKDEVSRSVQQADDGGFMVAGHTKSDDGDIGNNIGGEDIWLIKLDENGILQWEKNYGGQREDRAQSMQKVSTGGYVIGGWSRSNDVDLSENKGLIDIWIFKVDNDGNLQWEKNFGGSGIDQCFDIKETSDGGYVATGNSSSDNGDFIENLGSFDLWMMKLTPLSVGISEPTIRQNIIVFPNPNSGQFSINTSNLASPMNIKICDVQGRDVYSKSFTDLEPFISIDYLSKGLYILEVTSEDKRYFEKIIID